MLSDSGLMMTSFRSEREKFYPGPGLEPGCPALRACALITELSGTSTDP